MKNGSEIKPVRLLAIMESPRKNGNTDGGMHSNS